MQTWMEGFRQSIHFIEENFAHQIFHCLGVLILCIIPCLLVLIPIRFLTGLPSYVFRKMLHAIAFTGITIMILLAD